MAESKRTVSKEKQRKLQVMRKLKKYVKQEVNERRRPVTGSIFVARLAINQSSPRTCKPLKRAIIPPSRTEVALAAGHQLSVNS